MQLNMLVLTDIHYVGKANHICGIQERKSKQALELIQEVFESVERAKIDLVVLLGDLVDNGKASGAEEDMVALQKEISKLGKPVIVAPGNHDNCPKTVFEIFNDFEGLHNVNGYQIINFADRYAEDDSSERDMSAMENMFKDINPDQPVIALQHNPIFPPIESSYPYNLIRADNVMEFYTKKNVVLSVSGHLHRGTSAEIRNNVCYFTCSALCEAPFSYALITMTGKESDIEVRNL
ncbi:MAG: hypothetical protein GX783_12350 [Clostridiales bacterium]|nr:hypothetical protein [Clostridiales bacterium]